MDLFEHSRKQQIEQQAPLAARMRPRTLDEFAGQQHIIGEGRLLRRAIEADRHHPARLRAEIHREDRPPRRHHSLAASTRDS